LYDLSHVYFRRHREDKKAGGTGMARLIDADALKKEYRMADRCEDCARNSRDCQNVYSWTLMDVCSMLDKAPTIGSWISVKDRLPEEENACLAVDNECRVVIARYKSAGNYSMGWYSSMIFFPPITHWMPMPEAPKEKRDE
jgi:hypothetical protein